MTLTKEIAQKVLTTVDKGLSCGLGHPKPGQMCVEAAVCYALDGDKTFAEVIRSNGSKFWSSSELNKRFPRGCDCQFTISHVRNYGGGESGEESLWLVKDKDGKVIKSPSYSPANLKPILQNFNQHSKK